MSAPESGAVVDARNDLIQAFNRYSDATLAEGPDTEVIAEQRAAADELALAARGVADAVDALPRDRQPDGWARAICDSCGAWMPAPPEGVEPYIQNCDACSARFRANYPYANEPPF